MERHELLIEAVGLLRRCGAGFGSFVIGRKLARPEREKPRRDIAKLLDAVSQHDLEPEAVTLACPVCKIEVTFTKVAELQ